MPILVNLCTKYFPAMQMHIGVFELPEFVKFHPILILGVLLQLIQSQYLLDICFAKQFVLMIINNGTLYIYIYIYIYIVYLLILYIYITII